jgi:xanthine dehydrogenase/oxidase
MSDCRRDSQYDQRRLEVDRFNKDHKWRKRGIVLIPTKFGVCAVERFLIARAELDYH